jgi:uncharacterized membrane protein YadS
MVNSLPNWLGIQIFKLDRNMALLIGAGSSICGGVCCDGRNQFFPMVANSRK